jgi:hypothetical protein
MSDAQADDPAAATGQPPEEIGHRPPMSISAVAGLVCSLIIVVPFLTQFLGGVLGIVGIVQTSGRRRRGRKLAVAALGISIVVGIGWFVGGGLFFRSMFQSVDPVCERVCNLLVVDEEKLPAAAAEVREDVFTKRLKANVEAADLVAFVQQARRTHGQFKSLRRVRSTRSEADPPGTWPVRFMAEGDAGRAEVVVLIYFQGFEAKLDNLIVGDVSLLQIQ